MRTKWVVRLHDAFGTMWLSHVRKLDQPMLVVHPRAARWHWTFEEAEESRLMLHSLWPDVRFSVAARVPALTRQVR